MRIGPGGHVLKGVGGDTGLEVGSCLLLGAKQTHKHHSRLGSGGGAVELKTGVGSLEETNILELLRDAVEIRRAGAQAERQDKHHGQRQNFAELFHMDHPF